jgi:predicted O-methyltransferase YrrM
MNATALLNDIFTTQKVTDSDGNSYRLDSNIDIAEGEFLKQLIEKYKPVNTIEIGFAYGISSLYICTALDHIPGAQHTILDPVQSTYWKNIGVANLQRANISYFNLLEEQSEIALPKLLAEGRKFDFGFIDGNHTLDHTLIDFFYLNRMMEPGGIIVIDDVGMPAINKIVRYILNYPCYRLIASVDTRISSKRYFFDMLMKAPFRILSKLLPRRFKYEIFSGNLIKGNRELKLQTSMVALQKTAPDERAWNWYEDF